MIFYPKIYLKNILKIDYEMLRNNNIEGVILDVDNTLIDFERNLIEGAEKWCNDLKEKKIKFCIVSNSNKKDKVENVAKRLDIPYIYFAKKPLKKGLLRASEIMQLASSKIAVVGDQIFTDVIGANRCKMFSILVEPIDEKKDILITKIKRPIEKAIINSFLKRQVGGNKNDIL